MNKLESETYNSIMGELRLGFDPADPWGSNISNMFALCDYFYVVYGETLRGYQPSPFGYSLESIRMEHGDIIEVLEWADGESIQRVYSVLYRYDSLLRLAGKNY